MSFVRIKLNLQQLILVRLHLTTVGRLMLLLKIERKEAKVKCKFTTQQRKGNSTLNFLLLSVIEFQALIQENT